ncbi:MAG: hypothetical protein IJB01_09465 [Bacteroidaceae bacterium]|nr:hypothetical protein [Bacteroidaceae bacterium]
MAYLDHTRPYNGKPLEYTLCLTVDECKLLLPAIKTALKKQQKLYKATIRQQMDAETALEHLEEVVEKVEVLVNMFEK